MCDDDDEEVVAQGGDLHQHLLANGLCDFEVYEKSPRQTELSTHVKKVEKKFRSMSFLNIFIPYKKCNMLLIREIRDCHLLLEEDALYLESLCVLDIEESSNLLKTICISAAVTWPVMLLCHVPCRRLMSMSFMGFGLLSVRQLIGKIRQRMDHKLICGLVNALKGFSAICRKAQSLAQEWETVSGNMNILKDTSLLRAKMCGIDELKADLVRFLRLCVINLTESSRDIVSITTGSDLHPLCLEVMRSEVMVEHNSTLSKAKKLHYLYVLVQSDYLKNVAVSFIPCSKSTSNMAACVATVKNCMAYTSQYVQECTRILTEKYEALKNYTPQAKMNESLYKHYSRVSTFGDVRQTVNSITVCLEALTLQSLLAQRALERYDDSLVTSNAPANNVTDVDRICCGTQDALLGLQADLHAAQSSVELAVKQLTRLRNAGFGKRNQEQDDQEVNSGSQSRKSSEARIDVAKLTYLSDMPETVRDEVFELCERSAGDDLVASEQPCSLQETIQRRAEQRVAGRLIKELKSALVVKRAEMSAREEVARASNQSGASSKTSTSDMIASILDSYNEEMTMKSPPSTNASTQNDLEVIEKIVEPDVRCFKCPGTEKEDYNYHDIESNSNKDPSSSSTITSQSNADRIENIEEELLNQVDRQSNANEEIENPVELDEEEDSVCRDSSLESLFLAKEYSDLSSVKDQSEMNEEKPDGSEFEFDFLLNDPLPERDRYMDVQVLSKASDFCGVSSSEDGCTDSESQTKVSVRGNIANDENDDNDDLPISNGDYLLTDIPRRPKPLKRHPSSNRYRYEPESGDSRVQPLMGFKLPNEAVTKARELNLIGTEECFGSSD